MRPAQPPRPDGPPRVLGVRFGVNPNSSSLGVDVTFLLFGGALALGVSLALSALLRARALVAGPVPLHGETPSRSGSDGSSAAAAGGGPEAAAGQASDAAPPPTEGPGRPDGGSGPGGAA